MGFRLSGQVLETVTGLTPAQKLMLLGIAERSDQFGAYAFPSVATLATYAECSPRNVELGLRRLVDEGWVFVQQPATNRKPTTYRLNLERLLVIRSTHGHPQEPRGEEISGQLKISTDLLSENTPIFGRGENSSPLENNKQNRGEETAPQTAQRVPRPDLRGEVSGVPGAKISTARGEESSPDPIRRTDPGTDPKHTHRAPSALSIRLDELRARFDRVWAVYPRGSAKKLAWQEFQRLAPNDALTEELLEAIEHQKRTVWGGVAPKHIPHLRTWLHQERWTDARDDVAPVSQAELDAARQLRASKFLGRCPHAPVCPSHDACLKEIALRAREHQHRRPA